MSLEGAKISLIYVASAVVQALKNDTAINAVQPMRNGWLIYVCTMADRSCLVSTGITLAGQYVPLQSEERVHHKSTVKLTLRDLPLHSVSSEDVLETLKAVCEVQSEVQYANVWFEGRLTNIRNGDCFVCIDLNDLSKFEEFFSIGEHRACVFKPKMHLTCKHCGKDGHHASDMSCPARVPAEMSGTVEAF